MASTNPGLKEAVVMKSMLLVLFASPLLFATTYYVDNAGADSNNGATVGTPWQHLSKVNGSSFRPGDSVLLKRGGVWREQLNTPSSGASGNPINFGAYGAGARPQINASDLVNSWSSNGEAVANTWKAQVTTRPSIVVFDGKRGNLVASAAACTAPRNWFWSANILYTYGTVSPSSTYKTIEAGARNFAILNDTRDWVSYNNLDLRNSNQFGIKIQNSNHITLSDYSIAQSALNGTNVNNGPGQRSSYITFDRGEVSDSGGGGIDVNCGACGAITIDHITVTNNNVHDNGWNSDNSTGYVGTNGGIKLFGSSGTHCTIQNNLVVRQADQFGDLSGTGIWLDTWGDACDISYNEVHDNASYGILVENTALSSPTVVLSYNLVYRNNKGISVERGTHNVQVYNNSAYGNKLGGLLNEGFGNQHDQINNVFKNNISYGNGINLVAILGGENAGGGAGNVYDHNSFGAEAGNLVEWGEGGFKLNYAALDSAYGRPTNSVLGDPLMVDPSAGNLRLSQNSPAIGAGLNLGSSFQNGLDPRTVSPFGLLRQNTSGRWDVGAFVFNIDSSSAPLPPAGLQAIVQ